MRTYTARGGADRLPWRRYALVLTSLHEWQLERLACRLTYLIILVLGQFVQKLAGCGLILGKAIAVGQTGHRPAALSLFGIGLLQVHPGIDAPRRQHQREEKPRLCRLR